MERALESGGQQSAHSKAPKEPAVRRLAHRQSRTRVLDSDANPMSNPVSAVAIVAASAPAPVSALVDMTAASVAGPSTPTPASDRAPSMIPALPSMAVPASGRASVAAARTAGLSVPMPPSVETLVTLVTADVSTPAPESMLVRARSAIVAAISTNGLFDAVSVSLSPRSVALLSP